MKRWLFFLYGVFCHVLFLGVFAYMAAFVGGFLIPHTIDTAVPGTVAGAVAIDLALLAIFAAQHSVMARPGFKEVWTRIVPKPIERSTYVLIANLVTILLMWQWRGIDTVVWEVQHPALQTASWSLFSVGWLMVPLVSLMIDHFDLFGTRQVWLYLRKQEYKASAFRAPWFYKHVRHPLYIGWAIAFWATPKMTVGHLLFAGVLTGYMALAAIVEERDLIAHFGKHYLHYRQTVPMFIPGWKGAPNPAPIAVRESGSLSSLSDSEISHV
jgi:protein-S-isoprenylcysteine O-methyltransferase Ste14